MTPRSEEPAWLTSKTEHEGFPLLLRVRPSVEHLVAKYPHLVTVEQKLEKVRPDGLPEPGYNWSLEQFDLGVIGVAEASGPGRVVIVETFAGRRIYYAYVIDPGRAEKELGEFMSRYPEHEVKVQTESDPEWSLYRNYRSGFGW